jgi:hypothetical protein
MQTVDERTPLELFRKLNVHSGLRNFESGQPDTVRTFLPERRGVGRVQIPSVATDYIDYGLIRMTRDAFNFHVPCDSSRNEGGRCDLRSQQSFLMLSGHGTNASSTELVGEIVFGEAGEFVVEYGFVDFIGAESVRFSEGEFRFGVHALNAAAG